LQSVGLYLCSLGTQNAPYQQVPSHGWVVGSLIGTVCLEQNNLAEFVLIVGKLTEKQLVQQGQELQATGAAVTEGAAIGAMAEG
jgi:hypothetical protein